MFQRNDMVSDFAQVFRAVINDSPGFGSQQFAQCGLSAFDPARQNGFTANEGANENAWVGQPSASPASLPMSDPHQRANGSVEAFNRTLEAIAQGRTRCRCLGRPSSPVSLYHQHQDCVSQKQGILEAPGGMEIHRPSCLFANFPRLMARKPANPVPTRSRLSGSGTAGGSGDPEPKSAWKAGS